MSWIAIFLYLFAAGVSGALAAVPPRDLDRSFFKLHAVLMLVFVTIATAVGRPLLSGVQVDTMRFLTELIAWVLAADVVAISLFVFSSRPLHSIAFLLPVITAGVFAATIGLSSKLAPLLGGLLMTSHLLTSASLLGSSLVAMLLGHAYLRNAGMSFEPLTRLAMMFLGSAIAKTAVSLIFLASQQRRWWPRLFDDFDGMLVLTRVVAGLAVPILFAGMALSCAKSRANQSATGILYGAVIFVLAGELISMYMTFGRGSWL
ncbi:MAG TPA: hypothetical protein VGK61_05770 [Planctomycetota bacterium]